jgi:hypothetical protein
MRDEACVIVMLLGMQTTLYIQTKQTSAVGELWSIGSMRVGMLSERMAS